MTTLAKQLIAVFAGLLLIAALMGTIVWLYKDRQNQQLAITTLEKQVATQSQTIALQSLDFNRFTQIDQNIQTAKAESENELQERENEIRVDFKTVTVRDDCLPSATTNRLLSYTARLRAATVHPDQPKPDSADTSAFAGSCLTYQNAAVWLDKLLKALDDANTDKYGIRQQEKARQENYKNVTGSK